MLIQWLIIKLNKEEINFLINKYNVLNEEQCEYKQHKKILLNKNLVKEIEEYFKIEMGNENILKAFIKEEYSNNVKKNGFTTRKLSN